MEVSSMLWFTPFRVELGSEQLWREDHPIPLRPKTFAVLRHLLFVTGEPGIGKTTLVDAFLQQFPEQDLWIGHGHCIEQYGEGEAYMPIIEALGQLCRAPGCVASWARHRRFSQHS
jgi:hypothetical protein